MFPEEQVVDIYLRHYALKEEQDFWAFDEVNQIVRRDPAAGWRLTCLLVNKATSDEAQAYVAAGPLEDLLTLHGPTLIDHVAVAARADERLQLALSGVWLNRANISGQADDDLVPLSRRARDDLHRYRSCLILYARARAAPAKERCARCLDEMMQVISAGGLGIASAGVAF